MDVRQHCRRLRRYLKFLNVREENKKISNVLFTFCMQQEKEVKLGYFCRTDPKLVWVFFITKGDEQVLRMLLHCVKCFKEQNRGAKFYTTDEAVQTAISNLSFEETMEAIEYMENVPSGRPPSSSGTDILNGMDSFVDQLRPVDSDVACMIDEDRVTRSVLTTVKFPKRKNRVASEQLPRINSRPVKSNSNSAPGSGKTAAFSVVADSETDTVSLIDRVNLDSLIGQSSLRVEVVESQVGRMIVVDGKLSINAILDTPFSSYLLSSLARVTVLIYAPPCSGKTIFQQQTDFLAPLFVDTDVGLTSRYTITNRPDIISRSDRSIALVPSRGEFERRCRVRGLNPLPSWFEDVQRYCSFATLRIDSDDFLLQVFTSQSKKVWSLLSLDPG